MGLLPRKAPRPSSNWGYQALLSLISMSKHCNKTNKVNIIVDASGRNVVDYLERGKHGEAGIVLYVFSEGSQLTRTMSLG